MSLWFIYYLDHRPYFTWHQILLNLLSCSHALSEVPHCLFLSSWKWKIREDGTVDTKVVTVILTASAIIGIGLTILLADNSTNYQYNCSMNSRRSVHTIYMFCRSSVLTIVYKHWKHQQYVLLTFTHSKYLDISCGVPRGSILFIMYVNYINATSNYLSRILIADDTNLFINILIPLRWPQYKLTLH